MTDRPKGNAARRTTLDSMPSAPPNSRFIYGEAGFTSDSPDPLSRDRKRCGTAAQNNSELA